MRISPYLDRGVWVFDDPATGLVKEPFVAGMPEIFRFMVGEAYRFDALFSAAQFPGARYVLWHRREDSGGNWYVLGGTELEGWLCPALFKYFSEAPKGIYIQVL